MLNDESILSQFLWKRTSVPLARGLFHFLKSEDVPPEQLPLAAVHFSFFGFHSLANYCASAIWTRFIFQAPQWYTQATPFRLPRGSSS